MKIKTFLFSVLVFSSTQVFAQNTWYPLNVGTIQSLYSCHFVDPNTGWVVGSAGTIRKTTDGGRTWIAQSAGAPVEPRGIHFIDANIGYFVGHGGVIYKTVNGGANWAPQTSGTAQALRSVRFLNADTGWAAGDSGAVLKTINGGSSWNLQITNPNHIFSSVNFVNGNVGWVFGTVVLKTRDGGANWSPQTTPLTAVFTSAYFADTNTGWAVGTSGRIIKTVDGGTIWNSQTSGTTKIFRSIHFTDANNGWAFGLSGALVRTINGGTIWNPQAADTMVNFLSASFPDRTTGYVAGSGVHKTNAPLALPNLISPANNAVNSPLLPALIWNKVDSAWSYRVQLAADSNFTLLFLDSSAMIDTFKIVASSLSPATEYFWRVNSTNGGARGAWSNSGRFTTTSGVPLISETISNVPVRFYKGKLEFSLPNRTHVQTRLLNSKGSVIAVVLDEMREAGSYSLKIPPLPQGSYVLDFKAGKFRKTVKVGQ